MTDKKPELLELIEAYGAARATGNSLLIQSAAATLVSYLENVDIIERKQPEAEQEQDHE
jgi:hypothetical protein